MKLSVYNKLVESDDGTLLFNLVSGSLVVLRDRTLKAYRKLEAGDFSNQSFCDKLTELGYIVPPEDERIAMRAEYERQTLDFRKKYLYVTVTDRCNLGCHYCYEDKNQWLKMTDQTQAEVEDFAVRFIEGTPTDSFGVAWYGGEPLMHTPAVVRLSRFFRQLCEKHDVYFYQMMITNGTMLTEHVAEQVVDLGIDFFQITVDGWKEDHDQSRPYLVDLTADQMSPVQIAQREKMMSLPILGQSPPRPKARSSYDAIMKGIDRLVGRGGIVSLRMNVNAETITRCTMLLDDLYERGYFTKNDKGGYVYAYAHPIFEGCDSGCGNYETMSKEHFAKEVHRLREWYWSKGIEYFDHRNQMKFTGETCTANKKYEYVVNPDGTLTKCTHHVGNPNFVIGHVRDLDPNTASNGFDSFNPFDDEECANCEVLPICMGGCKSNNKVGQNKKYDAGCVTTRFALAEEVRLLYQAKLKEKAGV